VKLISFADGTHDATDLVGVDVERHRLHRANAAEFDADVADLEKRGHDFVLGRKIDFGIRACMPLTPLGLS
jgi:hypothetical protein